MATIISGENLLANGIVEFAAKDLRKAIRRDIKRKYYINIPSHQI